MGNFYLNHIEMAWLQSLLKAIDSRDWLNVEQMSRANPKMFVTVDKAVAKCSELNGMTILHACIRYDPPPWCVQLIIGLAPWSTARVDCLRRSPLHVAAAIRAHPHSIAMLVDAYPEACALQDMDGKIPLHFACDINW